MIHFFTDPYKDELIYSTIGRYHFYSTNQNLKDTIEQCFGLRTAISTFEFAGNLEYLTHELGGKYTSECIINKHTIFPFYSPFMNGDRKKEMLNKMKYEGTNTIYTKLGIVAGGICRKKDIYYCPICFKKEFNSLGEGYIHREHQLEGVLICPHDGCVLKKYTIRKLDVSRVQYIRLDNNKVKLDNISFNCEFYDELFRLSKDAYYLLSNELSFSNFEQVMCCYKKILLRKSMITSNGTIKQKKLYDAIIAYFGEDFLKIVESDIEFKNEFNWLKVLTRHNKRASHPLRHLLFIEFISESAEKFFEELRLNIDEVFTNNIDTIKYKFQDANMNFINRYKKNMLEYLRINTEVKRTDLRKALKKEYTYLYRYDREWLFTNLPSKTKNVKLGRSKVDWDLRDEEYFNKIKKEYELLISNDKPIRITRSSLTKHLGILVNIEKRINKLPKSKTLLDSICETVEQFQIRRCTHYIDVAYKNKNDDFKMWKIQRIGGIKGDNFRGIEKELQSYIKDVYEKD